jgi:multidrug resistance efflux pump
MKGKTWLFAAAGLILLVLAVVVYFLVQPAAWRRITSFLNLTSSEVAGVEASGFIEAEEIDVAAEIGGRIVELGVTEGDEIEPGDVLVRLDDTLVEAQVEVARAGVEVAQAMLAQVQAGARPEQIDQAQAALAQAEAARDGAYQAWQDMLALAENPQDLEAEIALAEAQLREAEAGVRQAEALRDVAQIANQGFESAIEQYPPGQQQRFLVAEGTLEEIFPLLPPELLGYISGLEDGTYTYQDWEITLSGGQIVVYRTVSFDYPLEAHLIPTNYWRAWAGYNTAQAGRQGARAALALLYAMRDNPQQLQAQVLAAEAEYQAAQAAVDMARAQLEGLQAGATAEELAGAEAQVQQAQSQLESALVMVDKLTLVAPAGGWVLETVGHVGELAVPGVPLVTVADLDRVTLTIYVPENRLGQVQLGQIVEVRVDAFPERVFFGRVESIASEAEFVPRNVQTQEERVNMVFAVDVSIPNPEHVLKPGMPADAFIFTPEERDDG